MVKVLEADVLELGVKFVVLGHHFVVPQDLLGDLFLSLGGLLLLDFLLEVFIEGLSLVLEFVFLSIVFSSHLVDVLGVFFDLF